MLLLRSVLAPVLQGSRHAHARPRPRGHHGHLRARAGAGHRPSRRPPPLRARAGPVEAGGGRRHHHPRRLGHRPRARQDGRGRRVRHGVRPGRGRLQPGRDQLYQRHGPPGRDRGRLADVARPAHEAVHRPRLGQGPVRARAPSGSGRSWTRSPTASTTTCTRTHGCTRASSTASSHGWPSPSPRARSGATSRWAWTSGIWRRSTATPRSPWRRHRGAGNPRAPTGSPSPRRTR